MAQVQLPFAHAVPGMHAMLQPPQCAWFVCVSVQAPAQGVPPPVHVQTPFVHAWPATQALPHVPQFVVSVVLTHVPLQFASPPEQTQTPPLHALPGAHGVPQVPQFALSVWVSTHAPSHSV